ncbi:MAG TPA: hypothetical protein VJU77_10900 [Chthoniobacterales bacterium]|nr:hypothetical protein [Chthoniobacterales bacterium]
MTFQKTTVSSLATLGLGVFVSGSALVQTAGFVALVGEFGLLALSPYVVFGGACLLANSSRGRAIATLVVCALATACAIFLYGDLIFLNPGSMSGLVFLLVPSYQLPAAILLLIVMFFTRPRRRSLDSNGGAS